MITDGEAVFVDFSESVFLVKTDRTRVFAEDTHVDFLGLDRLEVNHGPGHELVTESLAEEGLANVDLPDFGGVGRR